MMFRSFLATLLVSAQGSKDEETCALQNLRRTSNIELLEEEDASGHSYCAAIFHTDAVSVSECQNCVTQVKSDNQLSTTLLYHNSPWFAKEVASCVVNKVANPDINIVLPPKLANRLSTCSGIFGQVNCVNAMAHCLAVHADEALSALGTSATPEQQFDAMAGHEGYLSCVAHHLDHTFCLASPMGAGNCMAKGIECIDAGYAHGSDAFKMCFGQKRAEYFANNPAQKEVYDMCEYHYGQDHENDQAKKVALAKCGGCAMAAKMEFGNENGHSCVREHCLRIPALVQGVTQCMMNNDVPCDALNTQFIPAPFSGAVSTCTTVFGAARTQECLQNGAQCLGLHPCSDSASCAADDGWFACFAKKMGAQTCERHPAGMAKCLKCGVHLIKTGVCSDPTDCATKYAAGDSTVVTAHNTCVAAA